MTLDAAVDATQPPLPPTEQAPGRNAELPISPAHVEILEKRSIPLDVGLKAGLRSVTAEEAKAHLGFKPSSGGLLIPYPGTEYARLRCDEGSARYLAPTGKEVPVYVATDRVRDPVETIYVVEAPLKALALSAAGFPAVGLGGVATTLAKGTPLHLLNDSWRAISPAGRRVVVCFDAGRATNIRVAQAEARLVIALEIAGAEVLVAELPLDAGHDQGPDDFLTKMGRDALAGILGRARPADPVAHLSSLLGGANGHD